MKRLLILSLLHLSVVSWCSAQLSWGDQGNGTYINPVLCADFSDPDVIRVGEKYYMVASDFHFVGMQLLESDDLVNWRIVTQVYSRFDLPGWDTNSHYAGGSWAPALRYHDGKYWIYFCTPDEGLFMTQAERPEGPWSPLHCVKAVEKWEDPCPFWDDDGQAYLGRSRHGAGPIIVHRMSADGRQLLDDGVTVYTGPVAEGTKFLKRNGWYYLSIPEGGVGTGWQTILRSKNIYGPYEKRVVLEQGTTRVNGPHQGAIVQASPSALSNKAKGEEGDWWFLHFQHDGALGRVVHLQPMYWQDDWPVIGIDIDRNGIGEPVYVWRKPSAPPSAPERLRVLCEQSVPEGRAGAVGGASTLFTFQSPALNPQWQWNHNPADEAWSLTEHKGQLTLHALQADNFKQARNTLTQKVVGYESEVTVAIDCSHLAEGGRAGLACIGKPNVVSGIRKQGGKLCLYCGGDSEEKEMAVVGSRKIYLRLSFDMPNKQYRFAYSSDGKKFTAVGEPFFSDFGNWKGVRFGLFHYNQERSAGYVCVPWVRYDIKK